MTKKTYTVHRGMHDNGRDYARGDTIELAESDAEALLATGAVSAEGEEATSLAPRIRHTFGQEPPHSEIGNGSDSRVEGEGGVVVNDRRSRTQKKEA